MMTSGWRCSYSGNKIMHSRRLRVSQPYRAMLSLIVTVYSIGALSSHIVQTLDPVTSLSLQRASIMMYDDESKSIFVGDAHYFYRIDTETLHIDASRRITDPSNCSRFDTNKPAADKDDSFCRENQAPKECNNGKLSFFTSTCTGNEYFVLQDHHLPNALLVCSSLEQCQTFHKTSLESISRQDDNVEKAPQGWFCNSLHDKDMFSFVVGEITSYTEEFCPVWRYGPIDQSNFRFPHRIAARIIPEISHTSGSNPYILLLASIREKTRDHAGKNNWFDLENIEMEITKRNTSTYKAVCTKDECNSADFSRFLSTDPYDPENREKDGSEHEFIAFIYDELFLYFFTNHYAGEFQPLITRVCRSRSSYSQNGLVRSKISCGAYRPLHVLEAKIGEELSESWGETNAVFVIGQHSMCMFSMAIETNHEVVGIRKQLDNQMETSYNRKDCDFEDPPNTRVDTVLQNIAPVATYQFNLESFVIDIVHGHTVAILATDSGTIFRTIIFNATSEGDSFQANTKTDEYLQVDAQVLQLQLRYQTSQLFVLTQKRLYSFRTHRCETFLSCSSCIASMDPYCGWCPAINSCVERTKCPMPTPQARSVSSSSHARDFWLHGLDGETALSCPSLHDLEPKYISVRKNQVLSMYINSLPVLRPGNFWFALVEGYGTFSFHIVNSSLVAELYVPMLLQDSTDFIHQTTVTLMHGINMTQVWPLQLENSSSSSVPVNIYDCNLKTPLGCSGCPSICGWCAYDNKCARSHDLCRDGDPAMFLSVDKCPTIYSLPSQLVHVNQPAATTEWLGSQLVKPQIQHDQYMCHFAVIGSSLSSFPGTWQTVANYKNSSHIECPIPVQTEAIVLQVTLAFNEVPVDGISVRVLEFFDCFLQGGGVNRQDCGRCLANSSIPCGWCQRNQVLDQRCEFSNDCETDIILAATGDIDACPQPKIVSIQPQILPIFGGTELFVSGENLGRSMADIRSVSIAGVKCNLLDFHVQLGTIFCKVDPFLAVYSATPLIFQTRTNLTISSDIKVQVVRPFVNAVDPSVGIRAGGAKVTIKGDGFDAGRHLSVILDDVPCNVTFYNQTVMQCVLSSASEANVIARRNTEESLKHSLRVTRHQRSSDKGKVCVYIDGQCGSVEDGVTFTVRDNPVLLSTWPAVAPSLATFDVILTGTNMDAVQHAHLSVWLQENNVTIWNSTCTAHNASATLCPIPVLHSVVGMPPMILPGVPTTFYFQADSARYIRPGVRFMASPAITRIQPELASPGDIMVVSGEHLLSFGSFAMYVGGVKATIDGRSDNQVTIEVPEIETSAGQPLDVVYQLLDFGYNSSLLGSFQLRSVASSPDATPIAAGLVATCIVIVLVSVAIYHKSRRQRLKKEQLLIKQMQDLESQVIDVARQGFTELQEDGGLAVSAGEVDPRPYYDHARRVLFTYIDTHPIPTKPELPGTGECLDRFAFFLEQEVFLKTLVYALEKDPRALNVRDRCHIASLLMCIAHGNPPFANTILSTLLQQYFVVNAKKDPRLMLRRTESIAEKLLTAWLTTAMYRTVVKDVAKPLYNLIQALTLYSWKGPVDAITGAATYTLNSDALLRERIEVQLIILRINLNHTVYEVTVNSCDTISQARAKFKALLISSSVDIQDFDQRIFVLRQNDALRVMSDVDDSSIVENGWVRLNTVSFYKVESPADIDFVKSDIISQAPSKGKSKLIRSQPKQRVSPYDARPWHLVKPTDDTNASRIPSELFLTHLMTVKMTMQPFVDGLMEAIFNTEQPPAAVRYLFRLLDEQASALGITDDRVRHIWKSNALPLRFWVNLVKNPDFVLHVQQSRVVTSGLSTIAQVIMDSCSVSNQFLGKNSPANKHLYRKEVALYKQRVMNYFAVASQSSPTEEELHADFEFCSGEPPCPKLNALRGLMDYAMKFKNELLTELHHQQYASLANDFQSTLSIYTNQSERTQPTTKDEEIGYLNVYADDEDEEILEKRRSVVIDEDMFEIERESIPTPDSDDQILKSPQSGVF